MRSGPVSAHVLVDLGFGDAGKGLLTDWLVRQTGATLVVRYNGGAQAGHNVVTPDGRHHTFAQLGAGTFVPGVRTFLSRHVVIHPTALFLEAEALAGKGVGDALSRLSISEGALVITPFHQAMGRLRELARGPARHGSCGVGVGEAVADALAWPDEAIRTGDLRHPALLRRKLSHLRERKQAEVESLGPIAGTGAERERGVFTSPDLPERWRTAATRLAGLGLVVPDTTLAAFMAKARSVVFEGAQGVLLDEQAGFHPFTTWSRCTPGNAWELLAEAAPGALVQTIGVLRSHAVRHGPGPLPTESAEPRPAIFDHNGLGEWQGPVRYGWFDPVLARYALAVAGPLDRIVLTHLDAPARLGRWRVCIGYEMPAVEPGDADLIAVRDAAGRVTRLAAPAAPPAPVECRLARQERLTGLLSRVLPVLEDCEPSETAVLRRTEELLGRGVDFVSRGPRAGDLLENGNHGPC